MAADPSVSPADTIRRALGHLEEWDGISPAQVEDEEAACRALDALLAGGGRDKAEIERLAGIEAAARAYLDAEDADEEAVDRLISEDDTDGSLSEAQALTRANADAASDALRAVLAGGESPGERDRLKVEAYDAARAEVKIEGHTRAYYVLRAQHAEATGERDRRQIAQLTAEVERLLDCKGGGKGTVSVYGGEPAACETCVKAARAVLADEEDADG